MTYKAQAYRIRCVYNTGEQNLNIGFNVSTLTTAGTIANTGPAPTCTMRICNSNGDDISQAEIGDQLMLKVEVKNYPYFVFFQMIFFSFREYTNPVTQLQISFVYILLLNEIFLV